MLMLLFCRVLCRGVAPAFMANQIKTATPKPEFPEQLQLERHIDNPRAPDQANFIAFYDLWVARDLGGNKFGWLPPYVDDEGTQSAASKGAWMRCS